MSLSLAHKRNNWPEADPIFIEEKQGDGSVRYHMNEQLQKRAEAAVAKLSSGEPTCFERRVLEALRSGQH